MRPLRTTLAFVVATLAACGPPTEPSATQQRPATGSASRTMLHHDFGVVRHGRVARHEFEIPVDRSDGDPVPLLFQVKCSCVHAKLVVVGRDGDERYPDGNPLAHFAVGEGERLLLRLDLDTGLKPPEPLSKILESGQVVLQSQQPPFDRVLVPVSFTYGVAVPVEVRPSATIDFGRMPRSVRYGQTHVLRPLDGPVRFGSVRCLERDPDDPTRDREVPDVQVELSPDGDEFRLRLTFRPAFGRPLGPFAFRVEIETDVDGDYRLVLPVAGIVVPDIEIAPPGRLGFGMFDVTAPATQQVMITDHDTSRPAEFCVAAIVDRDGADMSGHFSARFEPVQNAPRSRNLILDYAGTLDVNSFRGDVRLAKIPGGEIVRSIEYVGHRRR